MTFSEKVQEARGQLMITQAQLAEALGVSFSTVNRWEKGRNEPQFLERRKFENFCKERGVTFADSDKRD